MTLKIVGRRFQLNLILVLVANAFGFDEKRPFIGTQLLMRHKRKILCGDRSGPNCFQDPRGLQVYEYAPRVIQVHLHKVRIVPFFYDIFTSGFL